MDLTIYDIIVRPVLTSKARRLSGKQQLVVEVHPHANKPMVVRALRHLFNVEVESIRSATDKGKQRVVGRRKVQSGMGKRMYVTLKQGQAVSNMGDLGAAVTVPVSTTQQV